MSAGNGGAGRVAVVHLVPVDLVRGRVDVRATISPEVALAAQDVKDGGVVALVIAQLLLESVAATAPRPVAGAAREALAALDAGMERARRESGT